MIRGLLVQLLYELCDLTRRWTKQYAVFLAGCTALLAISEGVAKSESELPSLKDVFGDDFITGVSLNARELVDPYAPLILKHFGSLTQENAMKPMATQPVKGHFTFRTADEIVAFARKNNLKVYGHTMVWHRQTPDWFFQRDDGTPLSNSPEDQAIASSI